MMKLGLYIHIPFCKSKCVYCDFNSYKGMEDIAEEYCNMVIKEAELFALGIDTKEYIISTIYIGGGTPSYIPYEYLNNIIDAIYRIFSVDDHIEFTIEANPGTLDAKKLSAYKAMGVNRLSIGLQAWQDGILKSMGRIHNTKDFVESIKMAQNTGIYNISCDLIFGYPGQTLKDWHETLDNVIKFKLPHLSCYGLKIEENTPLCEMVDSKAVLMLDEEEDRIMYHDAIEILKLNGYEHYEISNFCREGMYSRHNMIYWDARPYIGFGAGAHSFFRNRRFNNKTDPLKYINDLNSNKLPLEEDRVITIDELACDYTFLRLRLIDGLKYKDYSERFGREFTKIYHDKINGLLEKELITVNDDGIRLSKKGLDFANQVFVEFI